MELALKDKTNHNKATVLTILTLIIIYNVFNIFNHKMVTYKSTKEIYFNNYNAVDTIYPLY